MPCRIRLRPSCLLRKRVAELRRVGGEMEPHRQPGGRRDVLLPHEVELISALGIKEEEYWNFVDNYAAARSEEYAQIPDVRNDPVTPILINLVIGLALTAVGYLLSPKPRTPDQKQNRADIRLADQLGRSRFTNVDSFDSIQELARLGDIVPLIFADQVQYTDNGNLVTEGGIRVYGNLLWSQLLSLRKNQQLKVLVLLGVGGVAQRPDFNGIAIGDLLLHNYSSLKYDAYYRDNVRSSTDTDNRPDFRHIYEDAAENYGEIESNTRHRYSPFQAWLNSQDPKDNYAFSSTRSPSTKVRFGAYAPMPNGMMYKPDFELVFVKDGTGGEAKELARDRRRKYSTGWSKGDGPENSGRFPRLAGITDNGANTGIVKYTVRAEPYELDDNEYGESGIEDIISELDTLRVEIDDNIAEGELYLLGEVFGTCIERPLEVWRRLNEGKYEYEFRIDPDRRDYSKEAEDTKGVHAQTEGYQKEDSDFPYRTDGTVKREAGAPWYRAIPQRAAIASFTTNRPCDVVEIGLKSIVYRQITGFTNLNSLMDKDAIEEFEQDEEDNSQITPGRMTKYTSRWSFFQLYGRIMDGTDRRWQRLMPNDNDAYEAFAVYNNNPSELYNTIQIKQNGKDLYEYELRPVPGNLMIKRVLKDKKDVLVYLLTGNALDINDPERTNSFDVNGKPNSNGLNISFTGKIETLTSNKLMNPEWVRGKPYIDYYEIGDIKPTRTKDIAYPTGPLWNLLFSNVWAAGNSQHPFDGVVVLPNGLIEVWRAGQKQGISNTDTLSDPPRHRYLGRRCPVPLQTPIQNTI